MTTLKEIAERAGVSIGTVDRVLHNRGRVSQENIDKILKIASEYDYVPNQLARRLKKHETISFGVLMPPLDTEFGYWQQIETGIREAKEELKTLDVDIIYSYFDRKVPGSYTAAAEALMERGVTAYITVPLVVGEAREVAARFPDVPCVFIDSSLPDLKPRWDFSQDPVRAGKVASRLMYFLDPEIESVTTIQTFRSVYNGEMRAKSFSEDIKKRCPDVAVRNIYITESQNTHEALSCLSALQGTHNGLFVVNDGAHYICDVLDSLGISERFRIIGFDLSPENKECLAKGRVDVILGQMPRNQGYDAIMMLYRLYVLGLADQGFFQTPVDIYIRENITDTAYWG